MQHLRELPLARWPCAALLCLGTLSCASDGGHETAITSMLAVAALADGDFVQIPRTAPDQLALRSMGTVTEVGSGLADVYPTQGRLTLGGLSAGYQTPQQVTWFRIQPIQRGEILLAFAAPGFAPPIRAGDVIRVEAWSHPSSYGGGEGWFELRDESGLLLFWYGEAGRVARLKTPEELQLSESDVQERGSDKCVPSWEQKRIDAAAAGVSASIGWSEQTAVGDWLVSNLGVSVAPTATCPDASGTFAAAAVWPLSLTPNP